MEDVKKHCPELGPYMMNQMNFYLRSGKYTDVNSPFSKPKADTISEFSQIYGVNEEKGE